MSIISQAIAKEFPDLVQQDEAGNFYWENLDGDRFTFGTFEAAAEDVALDMAFYEDEAKRVLEG